MEPQLSNPPRRLRPREISVSEICTCPGTLGRVELEAVAACIVLYHWEHDLEDWTPVTRRQIADWVPTSPHLRKIASNPSWNIDLHGFIQDGSISGWDRPGPESIDDPGTVTDKFMEAVSNPRVGPAKQRP